MLILILLPISISNLIGQSFLNHTSIVGGVALSAQDRRSFSRSGKLTTTLPENNKIDYDLILYAEKLVFKYRFLQITGGFGYAEHNTLLSRQFNQQEFGSFTQDIKYIKFYTINKLIFPISSKFYLNKNGRFYLQLSTLPALGFRKNVFHMSQGKKLTKWLLDLNGLEINPGIGFNLTRKLQINIQYRCLTFMK